LRLSPRCFSRLACFEVFFSAMTSEKLLQTIKFLVDIDQRLSLQAILDRISSNLSSLASSPAQTTYQENLATQLEALDGATASLALELTPARVSAIEKIGAADFFNPHIAKKVREAVSQNAMTPSVARDVVESLATRRTAYVTTLEATLSGLMELGVKETTPPAGAADLSFIVPRDLFDNDLGQLAAELRYINRLLRHYGELVTGGTYTVRLEELSSSDPTISVLSTLELAEHIASTVSKLIELWKTVSEYLDARNMLTRLGLEGVALEQITDTATKKIETVIEETVEETITTTKYKGPRKNELRNALLIDTRFLYGQIERGLLVEVRAQAPTSPTDDDTKSINHISELNKTMVFPSRNPHPLFLPSGIPEDLLADDAEIEQTVVEKKRKTKTTTTESTK
jgi:DNA primase